MKVSKKLSANKVSKKREYDVITRGEKSCRRNVAKEAYECDFIRSHMFLLIFFSQITNSCVNFCENRPLHGMQQVHKQSM